MTLFQVHLQGTKKIMLNLKKLNKFVNYDHFKMESINNVTNPIQPNVFMESIDLKNTSFSVTVHVDD